MKKTPHQVYLGLPLDFDDSIRLLNLLPGHPEEPVRIRLLNSRIGLLLPTKRSSTPGGDQTLTSTIEVLSDEDESSAKPVTEICITANCHAVLKRLRSREADRIPWVDSICINQSVVSGRNHQVDLMRCIYQTASRVIIYLDESCENSREVRPPSSHLQMPSRIMLFSNTRKA